MTTRAERIAEIRERVEKATPGLWQAVWCDHQTSGGCCLVKRDNDVIAVIEGDAEENADGTGLRAEADAAFIAHARQDVFWLLAEVEWLEHLLRTFVPGPAAVMIGDPE